jgi:3-hydroxyisobutyrate dehydrogenase-like beta-hydroxyacid dehydrogenase
VYSDSQLKEVLFERGSLAAMRPGTTLAIHTTGSPALAQEIQAKAPADVSVIDATFSGGGADVAAGRLTLMVGGELRALERARPALASYASEIFHMGAVGHGQRAKLLNNLLFATNLMNAAEILRLAEAQGFHMTTIAQVVQASSGASYAMNMFRSEIPLRQRMERARPYLEKDVATIMQVVAEDGLDTEAFRQTAEYFRSRGT